MGEIHDTAGTRKVTVCLSWYSESEYEKLRSHVDKKLLPYEKWQEIFERAREHAISAYGDVLVVTVTAAALLELSKISGLPVGPELSATFSIAVAGGAIDAKVERFGKH